MTTHKASTERKRRGKVVGEGILSLIAFSSVTITLFTTWIIAQVAPVSGAVAGVIMFLTTGYLLDKREA